MYESFLVVFRESLELAIIVGVILAYLNKIGRGQLKNIVYVGIASGIGASALLAFLIHTFVGSFEGRSEQIFEGTIMLVAAVLLTTMILWFFKQQSIRANLERSVQSFWDKWSQTGLFFIVFLSVLREGVETVLFMSAIFLNNVNTLAVSLGGFVGLFLALLIGYTIFVLGKKLNLKYFFIVSNVLLVLFAAGLVAHGVHELQEAALLPILMEHVYDLNGILYEKGPVGSILKGLFGYNGNPSLIEVTSYVFYLVLISLFYKNIRTSLQPKKVTVE